MQKPAIAPGSVQLEALLGACTIRGRWYDCDTTVVRVDEYGSGTKQLPTGTAIRFSVLQSVHEQLIAKDAKLFDAESALRLELAYTRDTNSDPDIPEWKAVSVTKAEK